MLQYQNSNFFTNLVVNGDAGLFGATCWDVRTLIAHMIAESKSNQHNMLSENTASSLFCYRLSMWNHAFSTGSDGARQIEND